VTWATGRALTGLTWPISNDLTRPSSQRQDLSLRVLTVGLDAIANVVTGRETGLPKAAASASLTPCRRSINELLNLLWIVTSGLQLQVTDDKND